MEQGTTEFCADDSPRSGAFVVEPGADDATFSVLLDADGDGSYEQEQSLDARPKKTKTAASEIVFQPTLIAGKGILEVVADAATGQGEWTFTPSSNASAGSHTFRLAVRDADGDITQAEHTLVQQSAPTVSPDSAAQLELNEDALPGAGNDNPDPVVQTIGTTGQLDLQLTAGSEAISTAAFDPARLGAIQLSAAGLIDPVSAALFSFSVKSKAQKNDTLILRWDGQALARLQLQPLAAPIAAGQKGSLAITGELLGSLPSHLVRYQDSTYAPLRVLDLPLSLFSATDIGSVCITTAEFALQVHDDRPVVQLLNTAGDRSSVVPANQAVQGRWGDASAAGGLDAAVGADRRVYANADFAQAADWWVWIDHERRAFSAQQAAKGIAVRSRSKQDLGTLFVTDGDWRFEARAAITHQEQFDFRLMVVDADGDRQKVSHTVVVEAASAPALDAPRLVVDENNLPEGNGKGPNADVEVRDEKAIRVVAKTSDVSDLVFLYGDSSVKKKAVAPRVIDANGLEIAGLTWSRSRDGKELSGGYGTTEVIRLVLPQAVTIPAGSRKKIPIQVDLLDEARHHLIADDRYSLPNGPDYNGAITVVGVGLKATADNGQFATADAEVIVLDDMPAPLKLKGESVICAGGVKPLTGRFVVDPGADSDASSVLIAAGDQTLRLDRSTPSGFLWVDAVGRLEVDVDFTQEQARWRFLPDPALRQAQKGSFDVTVQDHDGDQRTASHAFEVVPPPSVDLGPTDGRLVLNEDALPISMIGPDSPYTSRYDNTAAGGASIALTIVGGDPTQQRLRFDAGRLDRIQVDDLQGLSFSTGGQGRRLQIHQASQGSKERIVWWLNWRSVLLRPDPTPVIPRSASMRRCTPI